MENLKEKDSSLNKWLLTKSDKNNNNDNINETLEKAIPTFNLYQVCENILKETKDSFYPKKINSKEIFRAYDYSLDEFYFKSKYCRKEDIKKRAQYYFSLYLKLNSTKYPHTTYNQNCYYSIKFSNTIFPVVSNNKIKQNIEINKLPNLGKININKYNFIPISPSYIKNNNQIIFPFPIINYSELYNQNYYGYNSFIKNELSEKNNKEKNNNFVLPLSPITLNENQKEIKKEKKADKDIIINDSFFNKSKAEAKENIKEEKNQLIGKKTKSKINIKDILDYKCNEKKRKHEEQIDNNPNKKESLSNINNFIKSTDHHYIESINIDKEDKKKKETIKVVIIPCNNSEIKESEKNDNLKSIINSQKISNSIKNNLEKSKEGSIISDISSKLNDSINTSLSNSEVNNTNNNTINNTINIQKEEKIINKESEIIQKYLKNENFIQFENDLKDYLKRIISSTREKMFFKNILPESRGFVQKLFNKDFNVIKDIVVPIYRNDFIEISLSIEQCGKIQKKVTILKS